MESSVSAGKKQEMRDKKQEYYFFASLRPVCRQAGFARESAAADQQFCGASLRGGPVILWDGFVNEICLKFVGDSIRFGFHPVTSIHFGCRPLFGARLLGEVIS